MSSESCDTGCLIGIIVGSVVVFAIAVVIVICYCVTHNNAPRRTVAPRPQSQELPSSPQEWRQHDIAGYHSEDIPPEDVQESSEAQLTATNSRPNSHPENEV